MELLVLSLLLTGAENAAAKKDESAMVSLSLGYIFRDLTQQYDNDQPWRRGMAVNADFTEWERDDCHKFGFSLYYQRFFQGQVPQYAYRDKASNWLLTVGPSYFLRTPPHRLPANLRLLCIPHFGFGIWSYTPFESSGNEITAACVFSCVFAAQFTTGKHLEWTFQVKPMKTGAQGGFVGGAELAAGFNYYF